ncbi:MAG: hypothetical protein PWQ67_1347 [Clostridia bacterium]|nr:hypothetical protein [Clostridia bacterium]MDN5322893.1 hypothetical protein [Clostridia bacterium]
MTLKDKDLFDICNKILIQLVIFLFTLVIFCQFLLLSRPLSIAISLIDKLEGERIEENIVYPAGDLALDINNLTLRLLNPYIFSLPKAKIYVNDELIADFTNLQQSLSVKVGDKVTIDNSSYSLNLIFKVTTTGNIKVSNHTVNVNKGQKITIDVEKPN